jgi:hypothetical protein
MTGVPVNNAASSEKILHDVRTTIAELVNDKFYITLKNLAHTKGVQFSAESIAPTFVSDGLMHYKHVDIPMGEFWLNSPTHDKPNDMFDAISGAHIYGKNIVQAEAFTALRSDWGEHPGNLKALGDRAFADGINKFSLHVFMHNPWINKKPGMTLDGIGLFYQRDQTWFKQSKAWIKYLTRCQALLQIGKPVIDIGVFTGEEIPRRSILPDRLVHTLPGIFGKEKVEEEKKRLQNEAQPMRTIPDGVTHSANMADRGKYIDALNGYKYDCFNPDVLMQMKVVNGRVVTTGGASYGVLVIPGKHPMDPNGTISTAVLNKLKQLANAGAKIIIDKVHIKSFNDNKNVVAAPYTETSFEKLGVKKDFQIENSNGSITWTHKKYGELDIYFVSNQTDSVQLVKFSIPVTGKMLQIFNPVTGSTGGYLSVPVEKGRSTDFLSLKPNESVFIVSSKINENYIVSRNVKEEHSSGPWIVMSPESIQLRKWQIFFDKDKGGPTLPLNLDGLKSWTLQSDSAIRYYSGTATYINNLTIDHKKWNSAYIIIDSIYNIATVKVNGINCGTIWTAPYELDITKAIKPGENKIEIEVTNTWRNRLIYDELNPDKRKTWLNSPYKLKDKPLLPAGIMGNVTLIIQ